MFLDMNKLFSRITIVAVVLCFAGTTFAAGTFAGRILPKGKVSIYHGQQKVGEFTSEAPLPLNTLMVTEKRCAVKADSLFMVAEDGTAFSISERGTDLELRIEKGIIYFALSALPRSLVFQTPDAVVTAHALTLNASTQDNLLKGYVKATKEGSEIGVYEGGSILIDTGKGEQVVSSGKKILLAQLPSSGATAGGGGGPLAGLSPLELGGLGVLAAGAIYGVAAAMNNDNGNPASVSVPPAK
jgi:hypothetical protein